MTTIYLIRHAEPDFSVHDDLCRPLTSKGRESCKKVTNYLADKQIDIILSSPYIRAVDTVKDFADYRNMQIQTRYDFRERAVDSTWIENFTEFVHMQWQDFNYKLKSGECLAEVQKRCIAELHSILGEQKDKNVVISSHGTAISTMINYYDKSYSEEQFNIIKGIMPFIVKMEFEDRICRSIEIIDITNNTPYIIFQGLFSTI